jgi:hypothetical protein
MGKSVRIACSLGFVVFVTACSTTPMVVELADSIYRPSSTKEGDQYGVSFVKVLNKADEGRFVNNPFGDSVFPIKPHTPTRETVEDDLRRFLIETLPVRQAAPRSLRVTISKAESYWIYGGAMTIPVIGLAFVGADTEFGMNLRVLFEIEENGKVTRSYLFDERITVQGKATTPDSIKESYQKLIAEYRTRFFGELETNFLNRYF